MLKACTVCGRATGSGRLNRCVEHMTPTRGWAHRKGATQCLREEALCWLCAQPARPDDPLEADHIVPRSRGGRDERLNMRAAHRSCNRKRGAALGPGAGADRGA